MLRTRYSSLNSVESMKTNVQEYMESNCPYKLVVSGKDKDPTEIRSSGTRVTRADFRTDH